MTSLNVPLPNELKSYLQQRSRQGKRTPAEYVRALIQEDRVAREELEAALMEGLNSGDPIVADEKYWANLKKASGSESRRVDAPRIAARFASCPR